jgi:hypothetical protein
MVGTPLVADAEAAVVVEALAAEVLLADEDDDEELLPQPATAASINAPTTHHTLVRSFMDYHSPPSTK